jgi:hypothetical protein
VSAPRRILALVLIVGAALAGARLFGVAAGGPVAFEIHYLLGPAPPLSALEVELRRRSDEPPVATFASHSVGPEVIEHARAPAGPVDLDITLVAPDGRRHTVHRTVSAERGAVVRIPLDREVAAWR